MITINVLLLFLVQEEHEFFNIYILEVLFQRSFVKQNKDWGKLKENKILSFLKKKFI